MKNPASLASGLFALCFWLFLTQPTLANIPGGGTGTGANVTLVDNGSTVTLANGIISLLCTKSGATINQINYTYNNGSGTKTISLLQGGTDGGQLYWETGGFGTGTFTYTLAVNPASNGGNYAEISLLSTSSTNGTMEIHFSMLRGSQGFYVTPIWSHRSQDIGMDMGETRDNIYAGSIFNWMSVDAARSRLMEVSGGSAIGVQGAPVEVSLWTNGIYSGQYEDKYKYSADFGNQHVYGWSSVGTGGANVGIWNISPSEEYHADGPMKRDLMEHIGTTILNMDNSSHYGGGANDSTWATGEVWTKVYGPFFVYCNNINNSITDTNQAAQTLYSDAIAQEQAEQGIDTNGQPTGVTGAWPYYWFTNANYASAAARGTITGQMVINDTGNPNASASNLWVGVIQQPSTTSASYDFQDWMKTYQFWVKTDTNGNFVIPNVIEGANYTLYAFGPGAAGTFQSQRQTGGNSPNTFDVPASPFSVTVTGGTTNNLGAVTWTPARVGATVFEMGYPSRTGQNKFRHGDDYWVSEFGPSASAPSPIWGKFLEFPFDFPNGMNYAVGQSRWTTDWNYVQPCIVSGNGFYNDSSATITFNLPSAPTAGSTASFYMALCSDYQGAVEISVNNTFISSSSGYSPNYSSSSSECDSTIREGINADFSDNRINFSGSLLHAGANTITIGLRQTGKVNGDGYFADHAMYDYIRLELTGYVPPAPASVIAYPGNNCNLVTWPVTPGATSYNIYSTTTSGSGYALVGSGVTGPTCGSGLNNATFVDSNAVNGVASYYVVQSVNPTGNSTNSPESAGTTPSASVPTSAPAAPTDLSVSSVGHQSVSLSWSPSVGADFYTIYRSVLVNNGGGASNVLGTIVLNNNVTSATYTDTSPDDGSIYNYFITATSAGGTSGNSAAVAAVPLPAPPASAPGGLTANFSVSGTVTLGWSPVSGAVGYVISRATSASGPFALVQSITETNYADTGLNAAATYYYNVVAMNAAGVSPTATVTVTAPPAAPASLSAIPGNTQVTLDWTAVPTASGYYLYSGTSSTSLSVLATNYVGTSYTNTGLLNGTTYFYEVAGTNSGGLGTNSPEASATPSAIIVITPRSLTWKGDGSANVWNVSGVANWQTNNVATIFNNGDTVTFDSTGSNNVPVTLGGAVLPALVTVNSTKNYTFSGQGSISGTTELIKTGSGTLTVTATNFYTGGTILSNGVIALSGPAVGGVTANNFGLGAGPLTFDGGTLQVYGYNLADNVNSYGSLTNDLVVPAGQTGSVLSAPRYTFGSKVTGAGTMNLSVDYVRGDIGGNWTGFTGLVNVHSLTGTPTGSGVDDFRVAAAGGFPTARLALGSNLSMYSRANAGAVIPIGEFSAAASTSVNANGGSGAGAQNAVTWRVGALNTDATNSAIFTGSITLIKEGTGSWTLTGVSTQTGSTTVNNGALIMNGSFSSSAVTVAGGTLGGSGILGTSAIVNAGAALAPGNPVGTLTFSNNLTLANGSTTYMQVQHSPLTNDAVTVMGTLLASGTLIVSNSTVTALAAGDSFKLFNTANIAGGFSALVLPSLNAGLVWNTNLLSVSGILAVTAYSPPNIGSLAINGGNLNISGTGGVADWNYYVLTATNLTGPWTPVATNRFDASGNFTFTNALNAGTAQMFYKLQLQ